MSRAVGGARAGWNANTESEKGVQNPNWQCRLFLQLHFGFWKLSTGQSLFLGLWTAYQNLQMAMNHKSLPCIPWDWKGEGAWSRLPAGPDHCRMLLGWTGRGMTSNCLWDVADVITKACLAFFGTRNLTIQQSSAGKAQTSVFLRDEIPNLSAKIKIISCV